MYPNVARYMNYLIRTGKSGRPKVQTIDGRWLYTNRGHEYALLNTQIQANAAIVLKRGIINLDAGGLGEFLRLPVHDELLLEAPVAMAADVLREAERILTDRESFRVPITWSGSILTERWVKT
jgi:DNA polymerase-1